MISLGGTVTAKAGANAVVIGKLWRVLSGNGNDADMGAIVRIMRSLTPLFIFDETAPQICRHDVRSASVCGQHQSAGNIRV
jgi:hypothetical protein